MSDLPQSKGAGIFKFFISGRPMTKREILHQVKEEVLAGKDRSQVFESYKQSFPRPLHLANFIASIPHEELKGRYRILNYFLLALLILGGIGKLFALITLFKGQNPALAIGLALLGLLVPLALAIEVVKMNGQVYQVIPIFCAAAYLQIVNHFQGIPDALIDAAFITLVLVITLLLKARLFPNIRWFRVKQDAQGNFVF
jgi:hypothetical protein